MGVKQKKTNKIDRCYVRISHLLTSVLSQLLAFYLSCHHVPWQQHTPCLKKVPTFKLSESLSNLNRFSKFLQCGKKAWNLLQNLYAITHITVACCYTTLGNKKFKFSADIQQTWKKMQTNCRDSVVYGTAITTLCRFVHYRSLVWK